MDYVNNSNNRWTRIFTSRSRTNSSTNRFRNNHLSTNKRPASFKNKSKTWPKHFFSVNPNCRNWKWPFKSIKNHAHPKISYKPKTKKSPNNTNRQTKKKLKWKIKMINWSNSCKRLKESFRNKYNWKIRKLINLNFNWKITLIFWKEIKWDSRSMWRTTRNYRRWLNHCNRRIFNWEKGWIM